jgi:type IV pilus assembly protein PilE
LVEVLTAVTVLAILTTASAPRVLRTLEQSHADLAGAGLRAIDAAQRFYWLDNRTFATNLTALQTAGLLTTDLVQATTRYNFSITAADTTSYTATATRVGSGVWSGGFSVNQTGSITGGLTGVGYSPIGVGYQ